MRRLAIPLFAVVLAALVLAPAASGVAHPTVRDVGPMVGIEASEKVLVGLPASLMLYGIKTRN